jgi:hypothetical protein
MQTLDGIPIERTGWLGWFSGANESAAVIIRFVCLSPPPTVSATPRACSLKGECRFFSLTDTAHPDFPQLFNE